MRPDPRPRRPIRPFLRPGPVAVLLAAATAAAAMPPPSQAQEDPAGPATGQTAPATGQTAPAADQSAPAADPADQTPPAADPADVESIDAIMTAVYDVISGDAGVARDWDRFRSLFAPGATLSPVGARPEGEGGSGGEVTYARSVITPGEYAERVGGFLEENGFHEVEINRVTERYGVIAHAFSTYESRRLATDPEPFARGINSFQLLHDGSRWWVVSIYWLQESPDHPIPARYLPGAGP